MVMKYVVTALLLAPAIARADGWSHTTMRGLDLYQIGGAGGVAINIICDPARVYGSDNSGIDLQLGAVGAPNGPVTFLAGAMSLDATAFRGRIGPDAPAWSAMLDLLGTEGAVQIEHGGVVYSLDLEGPAAFSCNA